MFIFKDEPNKNNGTIKFLWSISILYRCVIVIVRIMLIEIILHNSIQVNCEWSSKFGALCLYIYYTSFKLNL